MPDNQLRYVIYLYVIFIHMQESNDIKPMKMPKVLHFAILLHKTIV